MVVVFDLDDTLFDEIDFVRSGFAEIASYLQLPEAFDVMWTYFCEHGSGKVFDTLIAHFNLETPLQKLIEIYRFHPPALSLGAQSKALLSYAPRHKTGLITDGHYLMQQNKFHALGLERYVSYPVFTDFHHTKKPSQTPFRMVMEHFASEARFIYVSDNPRKDFDAPNQLGWESIRFRNPLGIYRDEKNTARYEVTSRAAILATLMEVCA